MIWLYNPFIYPIQGPVLAKLAQANGLFLLGWQVIRALKGGDTIPAANILTYTVNKEGEI
jgi:hypothetical protein